jgi:tRNA G18 (ribose-2'-O)-methylase SpoU
VGRRGLFIAEGRVVLEKAIAACPEQLDSILVSESKLAGLAELLVGVPPTVPVFVGSQAVLDAVVGFPIHRGVLAAGRRRDLDPQRLLEPLATKALVVGLIGIANHDNMGGIFRNAAAFGADGVLLDAASCDPLYRKAIRVSVGAALTTSFARLGESNAMLDLLQANGFDVLALAPGGDVDLRDLRPEHRTAVLFGAEGSGLPSSLLQRVRTVRIPMAGGFDSLNVATTSGIVLHHLRASN